MGQKMSNAPLYFTVAQVRFNPVLNLDAYLPAIQDQFRRIHFPDFKRMDVQRLIVPFGSVAEGGQPPVPSFVRQSSCSFGDPEGRTGFVLEHNALALQTTSYDSFETFSGLLLKGLHIVHEALALEFSERIGLRYLDAVLPKAGERLSDYLTPEVLGLSEKSPGHLVHAVSETVAMTSAGQIVSRVIIRDGHVGLPQEMSALAPTINPRFTEPEGRHAILDTDAYSEQREAFDPVKLGSRLDGLHEEIHQAFEAKVTQHAMAVWK